MDDIRRKNNLNNISKNYVKNIQNIQMRMTPSISITEGNKDNIMFISQPNSQTQLSNGQNFSMINTPMIPVFASDKQLTATQMNLQIIEEVKKEKEKSVIVEDINSIYLKNKKKCDLHPKLLSNNCRKCKEIKAAIEQDLDKSKIVAQTQKETTEETKDNFYGDPITCNLNSLLFNNIISCQYFKDEIALKGFNEILDEIIKNVTYVEPWAIGMSGVPSTLFCCLYKLMLLKLSEPELTCLLTFNECVYVRCVGLLYIRYTANPVDLWERLSPFLKETTKFSPQVDKKVQITLGNFVENLLTSYDFYGTRLPRIPIQIERDIKVQISEISDRRNKSRSNSHERRRSRSRSRSNSSEIRKRIKNKERESAVSKGSYYTKKGTFKTVFSPASKRKARSPSPLEQNIKIIEKVPVDKSTSKKVISQDYVERQEILKRQYGNYESNKSSKDKTQKKEDDLEIFKLG